jgi:hypothetical protein
MSTLTQWSHVGFGRIPGKHFIENCSRRVDVGTSVETVREELLGRCISSRSGERPHLEFARTMQCATQAKSASPSG